MSMRTISLEELEAVNRVLKVGGYNLLQYRRGADSFVKAVQRTLKSFDGQLNLVSKLSLLLDSGSAPILSRA